ncbi:Hypothetical protein DAL_50 [Psychrobacter phage D'Alembert]|nr:Hypothetical protein DAL_50 [Psychrobacter phage D'Alembert]
MKNEYKKDESHRSELFQKYFFEKEKEWAYTHETDMELTKAYENLFNKAYCNLFDGNKVLGGLEYRECVAFIKYNW